MKVILVLEDENRNACNILLAELNKRAWWDPMGIFTKTDHIRFHKKQFNLKGNWKIDYTNTAHVNRRWSDEWKKYIPRPFLDINGVSCESWKYNPIKDQLEPPFTPPDEIYYYNEYGDSLWRWDEINQCYVISKHLCAVRGIEYKPQKYDRMKGLIDLSDDRSNREFFT